MDLAHPANLRDRHLRWVRADQGHYLHEVRDALRALRWRRGGKRPTDLVEPAPPHLRAPDYLATGALLRRRAPPAQDLHRSLVRTALAGALWTQVRLAAVSRVREQRRAAAECREPDPAAMLSSSCPLCDADVPETAEHIFFECRHPALLAARAAQPVETAGLEPLPACWRWAGVALEDPAAAALLRALPPDNGDPAPPGDVHNHDAHYRPDGFVLVSGDGACSDQAHPLARRAGYGVYFGIDHPYNLSEPLLGSHQTAQRAELRAYVRTCAWAWAPTEYLTDSQLVLDTHAALVSAATAQHPAHPALTRLPHQDLVCTGCGAHTLPAARPPSASQRW